MKSKEEVQAKFEDLRRRRLSQRREKFLSKDFRNCRHNIRMRVKDNGKCGFCRCPEVMERTKGQPFVCDEEGTARRCKFFDCRNTPETVEEDFEEVLRSPARCGNEYPKLAIMIWFLQDTSRRTRYQRLCTATREVFRSIISLLLWRWW
jgi:hypothetical protein